MKIFVLKIIAVLLFASLLPICAHSQTFQVTTTADSGPGSLREAMTNAIEAGGGTITFPNVSGMINLRSALPDISGNLTIVGNGPEHLAINSYRTNRIFNVLPGATCNISDLSVQGGGPTYSGNPGSIPASTAIFNAGTVSISNCFVHDNGSGSISGGTGGTISSGVGGLVLNNVVLSNNFGHYTTALGAYNVRATNCLFIGNGTGDGAPIFVGGDSVFSGCTFRRNQAVYEGQGGGISASGNLTLLNCTITNNYGDWSTGGIRFNGNNLVISNCVINNNEAGRSYGGMYVVATNILIVNSSISGNYAFDSTGGIFLSGNARLIGCTISSNRSVILSPGAAIAVSGGLLNMTNCTIDRTTAKYVSSIGIYCANNGTVQAVNCTIVSNACGVDNSNKGTFYAFNTLIANNDTDFSGTLTSQGYNLVGNLGTNMTVIGSTIGNIYGVDPLLGPLQNNGGSTLTHAFIRGSPAIDAGSKDGAPLTDQRGVVRPYGNGVDIGAFESEYNVLRFADISRTNSTDIDLQLVGLPGSVCTIQASSNCLDWENVCASSNGTTGIWDFVDQDAGNHPNRFYRAFIDN